MPGFKSPLSRQLGLGAAAFIAAAFLVGGCRATMVNDAAVAPSPGISGGSGPDSIVLSRPPPPDRRETVPPAPAPDEAWIPGHWEYEGGRFAWIRGRWAAKPTPTAAYLPAHWERRPDGYVFIPGSWAE